MSKSRPITGDVIRHVPTQKRGIVISAELFGPIRIRLDGEYIDQWVLAASLRRLMTTGEEIIG